MAQDPAGASHEAPVLCASVQPSEAAAPARCGYPGARTTRGERWRLPPPRLPLAAPALGGSTALADTLAAQRSIALPAPASGRTRRATSSVLRGGFEPAGATPDIFGSIALPVRQTPLDAQWRRVMAAPLPTEWTRDLPRLRGDNGEAVLEAVNHWVNSHVAFSDDGRGAAHADRWSGAAETLSRGRGDCEDYALTKLQLLRALGFAADDLYLVIARHRVRHADHAVLVARLADRFVVLDNLSDSLAESGAVSDYEPVFSFSASGRWAHGFRADPSVRIAAASGGVTSGW